MILYFTRNENLTEVVQFRNTLCILYSEIEWKGTQLNFVFCIVLNCKEKVVFGIIKYNLLHLDKFIFCWCNLLLVGYLTLFFFNLTYYFGVTILKCFFFVSDRLITFKYRILFTSGVTAVCVAKCKKNKMKNKMNKMYIAVY